MGDITATEPLTRLRKYVRDVMVHPVQLVKIGRVNFERKDFDTDFIVVDELQSTTQFITSSFDDVAETMTTCVAMKGSYTVDFFGKNARRNSFKFLGKLLSEASLVAQKEHTITIYHPSSVSDLRHLTGAQYSNRYQLQFEMRYNETIIEQILRIDTAQMQIVTEQETIDFEI